MTRPGSGQIETPAPQHFSDGKELYSLLSVTPAVPEKRNPHRSPGIGGFPEERGALSTEKPPSSWTLRDAALAGHGSLCQQKKKSLFHLLCRARDPLAAWAGLGAAAEPLKSHCPPQSKTPPLGFNPGSPRHQHGALT